MTIRRTLTFASDPRTVARDIPGLFDTLFPHLMAGVVAQFNKDFKVASDVSSIPYELVSKSNLQRPMLFEVAVAAAEQLLMGEPIDWSTCLESARNSQKKHFNAILPVDLTEADVVVSLIVAQNLEKMIKQLAKPTAEFIRSSPLIPGYQWISSGVGDFSFGSTLIEVKCTNKNFSSSDYRQIVMYWLLSYAASVEHGDPEWSTGLLINPRLGYIVKFDFNRIVTVIGGGRSKVEILELFSSMVSSNTPRL